MNIRVARAADLPFLADVERAAGELFREVGMAEIADDDPFPLDVLEAYRRAGHAWVAAGSGGVPAGYLVADAVDGNLHIEQVSVDPRYARRGIGRRLIDHVAEHAGTPALTLTTFADVPWNGPYYRRCQFVELADEELTAGLRAIREDEAERGLDRWPRICMRRDLLK
jgi:GNAT superfamily N-acetyltransferase